jgi:hypothetical protein
MYLAFCCHASPHSQKCLFSPLHHCSVLRNSWDRILFVTQKGEAETGYYTDYNHLTQNYLLGNFESQESIDNVSAQPPTPAPPCSALTPTSPTHSQDDGSAYYNSSYNFLYLSGNGCVFAAFKRACSPLSPPAFPPSPLQS